MRKVFIILLTLLSSVSLTYAGNNTYRDGYKDGYEDAQDEDHHWSDELLKQGYVPLGATPKVIIEPGGEPGYYPTDKWSNAARALEKFNKQQEERQDKEMDRKMKAIKLYKEAVDAGYPPMQAWDEILKPIGFPPPDE